MKLCNFKLFAVSCSIFVLLTVPMVWIGGVMTAADSEGQTVESHHRATWQARLLDGSTQQGWMAGGDDEEDQLRFVSTNGQVVDLHAIKRLSQPSQQLPYGAGRLCEIELCTGERFLTSLLKFDGKHLTIEWPGGERTRIPHEFVRELGPPAGWTPGDYQNFAADCRLTAAVAEPSQTNRPRKQASLDPHVPAGQTRVLLFPLLAAAVGPKTTNQLTQNRPQAASAGFWADCVLQESQESPPIYSVRFEFTSGTNWIVTSTTTDWQVTGTRGQRSPRLPRQVGTQHFAVWQCADRLQLLINGQTIATARATGDVLQRMQIHVAHAAKTGAMHLPSVTLQTRRSAWIDDLTPAMIEKQRRAWKGFAASDRATVVSNRFGVLYGTLESVDSRGVVLRTLGQRQEIRWQDIRRVTLPRLERQPHKHATPEVARPMFETLRGWWGRLRLTPLCSLPSSPVAPLDVAVVAADPSSVTFTHPFLGRCRVALSGVADWQPHFQGTQQMLLSEYVHLGNKLRHDFPNPQPQQFPLQGAFTLSAPAANKPARLILFAADLHPAGGNTPPDSRFLRELRSGWLNTTIAVNGRDVGVLNRHVHRLHDVDDPARIVIHVPASHLQVGKNRWTISQQPSETDQRKRDNCLIGPLIFAQTD